MPAPRNHPHRRRGFFAQSGAGHPHPYLRMHEGGQPRGLAARRSATIPASSRAASRTRNRPCSTPGSKKRSSPSTISKATNPDYFLMPLRRFLGKSGLRRHEMDMLMGICPPGGQSQEGGGKINGQGLREQGPRPCPWANSSTQPPAAKAKGICTGSSQSVPTCPRRHPSGRTAGSSFFRTDAG